MKLLLSISFILITSFGFSQKTSIKIEKEILTVTISGIVKNDGYINKKLKQYKLKLKVLGGENVKIVSYESVFPTKDGKLKTLPIIGNYIDEEIMTYIRIAKPHSKISFFNITALQNGNIIKLPSLTVRL